MRAEMLHPDHTRRIAVGPPSREEGWAVRSKWIFILFAIALTLAGAFTSATAAADKPEELYFSGRLIELDAAKHTFTVRSRNKELVFTIDPSRCDITADGSIIRRSLKFARIGDAVMGELSLKEAKPYVAWVEFTHKPLVGKAVPKQPGYIFSPYLPTWPQPGYHAEAMDARHLAHGDMVYDDVSGKIFLVP